MNLSYAYISINIISLVIILGAFIVTIIKFGKKRNMALSLVIALIFIASFCILMENINNTFEGKHLWRNISQIGLFILPSASYNFIMVYINEENKFFKYLRFINFIFSITCVILIFTNDYHGIMRENVYLAQTSTGLALKVKQTLLGKICVSINTLMNIIGLIKLWIYLRITSSTTKMQVRLVLIGFFIPVIFTYTKSAILNSLGIEIPTPLSFMIGVIFILIGIYRYDFMSISPIARDWVIDEINVGMIFTNINGELVDMNNYSKKIFGDDFEYVSNIIKNIDVWYKNINTENKEKDKEIEIDFTNKIYSVKIHNLSKKDKYVGAVSLIRDITDEKAYLSMIKKRAETDSMTSVFNRQAFKDKIKDLIKNARDNKRNCALIIFDIDYFKKVNDTYGHQMGDFVIKKIVEVIKSSCQDNSFIGRLGGDEFSMFVMDTTKYEVNNIIKKIQIGLENYDFHYEDQIFNQTLSIGITLRSLVNLKFKELYGEADEALYTAKENGRNKAVFF